MTKRPVCLLILDGWGYRAESKDNGIALANKTYFDSLLKRFPSSLIDGSGPAVGLPEGVMGNSEVGHMNLGAGRVVYSGLSQVYQSIEDGSFQNNAAFKKAIDHVKANGSCLHLMGLLSDGAVHSHQDHLYALLELAKNHGIKNVAVHCFLDGRDTPPKDGSKYLELLQQKLKFIGVGRVASVSGRFYAMDRDNRWGRLQLAFEAICGRGAETSQDASDYLSQSYAKNNGDEFVLPATLLDEDNKSNGVSSDDAMIFFNFRADRAREITKVFTDKEFDGFDRKGQSLPSVYVCMTPYDSSFDLPVAYTPTYPKKILAEVLAEEGVKQLRIAETEKYAHVTFFFNGGQDKVVEGEDRLLIPSPKEVATYDLKPEMSAFKVKDALIEKIESKDYGCIICNFANADMVGHTAVPEAIYKAIETVDKCLSEVIPKVLDQDGVVLVTADHGNAELMVDENGEPMTAHTTNLVPFIVVSKDLTSVKIREGGRLCDVAPTILKLLGIHQPEEMTGQSLV